MQKYLLVFSFILSLLGGYLGFRLAEIPHQNNITEVNIDNTSGKLPALSFGANPFSFFWPQKELAAPQSNLPDLTFASEKTVETVVHIQTHFVREEVYYDPFMHFFYGENAYKIRERHGNSSGSGVVISQDGYIVTNNHVVQDAKEISVVLDNVKYEGKLIGTDPSTDLAVVKIEAKDLAFSEFGNSDELRLGEWVLAVGNPMNLQSTVTAGIVSAKNRNIDLLTSKYNPEENVFPIESFIQTDAAVNSGNSGGALVNTRGELVGINTAIASGNGFYTGYSFAIPSNIVKKVAVDLIKYGKVNRVQLGAGLINNNSEVAKKNELSIDKGIVLTTISEKSNAAKADLKTNDIILELDGKSVSSVAEFQGMLVLYNPGDKVNLKIRRGNTDKTIELKLE
ncbi:MAG: trypsin-like peptidase domain-containing protein [Crocinitomicaceae bacterium]|nr:trypsin-like peptidase domain-containing protein [Crocinitomicaceae bacterium]